MTAPQDDLATMPVIRDLAHFDRNSGNALERLVFNHRVVMLALCAVLTVVLGYFAATKLVLNASFEKMIPQSQAYIKNYLAYKNDLRGLGNALRVVVENTCCSEHSRHTRRSLATWPAASSSSAMNRYPNSGSSACTSTMALVRYASSRSRWHTGALSHL